MCKNCSLYDSKNTCHCENLINFSLKQGWISLNNPVRIESEVKDLKNVVFLYKTLKEPSPTNKLNKEIQQLLADKVDFLILNAKKVK